MKLEVKQRIDGRLVEEIGKIGEYRYFRRQIDWNDHVYVLDSNDDVVGEILVDCSQNTGFISELKEL